MLGESGPSQAGWHQVETFLRCPKEYQFAHTRGISTPVAQEPDYFVVGRLVHAMRARWFSLRFRVDDEALQLIDKACDEEIENGKLPASLKAIQQAKVYFLEYRTHWAKRPKPSPVAAEYLLGPAPLAPDDPFFLFRTARLDDVSRYPEAGDALCIGESKTTSTSVNDCVNQYTLHGQPLLQAHLWKMAPQGEKTFGPIKGVMLDVIVKGYGKPSQFARVFIPVTDHALEWFIKNMRAQLRAAASVDWNSDVPRNIGMCTRLVGRARVACPYRDLCSHGRSASIKYVLRDGSSLLTWKQDNEHKVAPWI